MDYIQELIKLKLLNVGDSATAGETMKILCFCQNMLDTVQLVAGHMTSSNVI